MFLNAQRIGLSGWIGRAGRNRSSMPQNSIKIEREGISIATAPLATALSDRDDEPFLEVAVAANAETPGDSVPLVTGNTKHFPEESRQGVAIASPRFFVDHYDESARQ